MSSIGSTFQAFLSAKRVYILYKSPTHIAASSPPAPGRISTSTSFSSSGSFGKRAIFMFSVRSTIEDFDSLTNSSSSVFMSVSSSDFNISSASAISPLSVLHSLNKTTIAVTSLCLLANSAYAFGSEDMSIFCNSASISPSEFSKAVSFSTRASSIF